MDEVNNKVVTSMLEDTQARGKTHATDPENEADLDSSLPQIKPSKSTNLEPSSARRGTGPRTEAGKQKSSKNATRHGIFANAILIQGESSCQFYSLLRRVKQDAQALEEVERILIEKLGIIVWRQARFLKAEAAEFVKAIEFAEVDQFDPQALNFDASSPLEAAQLQGRQERIASSDSRQILGKKQPLLLPSPEILERLMAYERHLGRELDRVLTQLERVRRIRMKDPAASTSSSTEPRGISERKRKASSAKENNPGCKRESHRG